MAKELMQRFTIVGSRWNFVD